MILRTETNAISETHKDEVPTHLRKQQRAVYTQKEGSQPLLEVTKLSSTATRTNGTNHRVSCAVDLHPIERLEHNQA
jgi:hypothetical protein